jgi:hypothetical protein
MPWKPSSLCKRQESYLNRFQEKKAPSRRRKTCFACMKAGKEQAQPQLYGTSYCFNYLKLSHTTPFSERTLDQLSETP